MAKRKNQKIKPAWKPAMRNPLDYSEIDLDGVTYEGSVRKKRINNEDRKIVTMAGVKYHESNPGIPIRAAITIAFQAYWERQND